jgi:glutamate-1-semialdehyde 2,1-aminomutase
MVTIAGDLFEEAKQYIPGGVNSPVRSFTAVGGYPVFVKKALGSKIYGECGSEFIDYCLSWGALILGHAHPGVTESLSRALKNGTSFGAVTKLETELAKLIIEAVPSVEQVRLTNSGTEAVMGAVRLARAYTTKNKIIKFDGSYHGHADYLLTSPGVPEDFIKHTISLPLNNMGELERAVREYEKDLAAIIVEPVAANCGVVMPRDGFLEGLRKIADKYNVVLIFDEVITGFRLSYGGGQGFFNVKPDLTCLGKIVGGGLPGGAFGGRREIMELLAPLGGVYEASTLAGNPLAVTAGIATLRTLKKDDPYGAMKKKTQTLCEGIKSMAKKRGIKIRVNYAGSIFSVFFTDRDVTDYGTAKLQNVTFFKRFFHGLLKKGIYFSPSGSEANFLSLAHEREDIESTLNGTDEVFKNIGG